MKKHHVLDFSRVFFEGIWVSFKGILNMILFMDQVSLNKPQCNGASTHLSRGSLNKLISQKKKKKKKKIFILTINFLKAHFKYSLFTILFKY
jgi:hypothetical protein